jgi:hypothetical protein
MNLFLLKFEHLILHSSSIVFVSMYKLKAFPGQESCDYQADYRIGQPGIRKISDREAGEKGGR